MKSPKENEENQGKVSKSRKRKKTRKLAVSEDKKAEFAKLIEKYPPLWNISHPGYQKRDEKAKCWDMVSEQVELSVEDCKQLWKSLKNALKYRQTPDKRRKGKSGDSGDDNLSDGDNFEDSHPADIGEVWPLWESLKFMVDNKPQRKTIASQLQDESTLSSEGHELLDPMEVPAKDDELVHDVSVTDMSTDRYNLSAPTGHKSNASRADKRRVCSNYNYASSHKQIELKYISIYGNWDRLLQKLPDSIVEDLNMQITSLVYNEVKKYENSQLVIIN